MFEKLLQKILISKLGKFIADLDRDSLKVALWSGDITLQNVHLKPDTLLKFQLPLFLALGKITRLTIKVPWSRLSSAPVQILLEGLYVVVVPQSRSKWSYSEPGQILRRKETLESYETRRTRELDRKNLSPEEEQKQKSFVERLGSKVIDNLKISIQDIHVRFEAQGFSTGLTLQSIECFTTDSSWQAHYADRSLADTFKLLNVNALALYWTTNDPMMISENSDEDAQIAYLAQLIRAGHDYVICPINAVAKVTHRHTTGGFTLPIYAVELQLPEVVLRYHQRQFHDTVKLFEYFTEYNKFLIQAQRVKRFKVLSPAEKTPASMWRFAQDCVVRIVRQRRDRTKNYFEMPAAVRKAHEEQFKMTHRKKLKGVEVTPQEEARYEAAVYLNEIADLMEWTDHVLSVVRLQKAQPKGWFGFWGKAAPEEDFEKIFSEALQEKSERYPSDYVWVDFRFRLSAGTLELLKLQAGLEEALRFRCSGFGVNASKMVRGADCSAHVDDFEVFIQDSPLCAKLRAEEGAHLALLEVRLQPHDLDCEASVSFTVQPLEILFSKRALGMAVSFFVVPAAEESAKNAAWDTLQGLQDSTQETLMDLLYGESKYLLNISVIGPQVRLPWANEKGSFVLGLRQLRVHNAEAASEGTHENYALTISGLHLSESERPVVAPFEINVEVQFMKGKYRTRKWELQDRGLLGVPDIRIEGELPSLQCRLSPTIYHQLKRLDSLFSLQKEAYMLDKEHVLRLALKTGRARKQGTNVQNWFDYTVVLSGSYLYFYDSSGAAVEYYYVKDCGIADCSLATGIPGSLRLSNRYGECVLTFESQAELQAWQTTLSEIVNEIQSSSSAAIKKTAYQLTSAHWMHVDFTLPLISLMLSNEEGLPLSEFRLRGITSGIRCRVFDIQAAVSLQHVQAVDVNRSGFMSYLLISKEDAKVIDFSLRYAGSRSPLYEGKDIVADAQLGSLTLNWNPDLLQSIFNFFEFASFSEPAILAQSGLGGLQPNHTLFQLSLHITHLDLFLNVVQHELQLAQVTFQSTKSSFAVKNGGYDWTLNCTNIQIFDLTNYPRTALKLPIVPFKLFSVRTHTESLLDCKVRIYAEDNPERPPQLGATVDLHLGSARIVYLHQPVFRIIDYFNVRILGLFDAEARLKDSVTWSPVYRVTNMFSASTVQLLSEQPTSQQRSFTAISVQVENPLLHFLPRPNFKQDFTADLGTITVTNQPSTSGKRHKSEPVWVDVFDVQMSNVNIKSGGRTVVQEFNAQLSVERPVLSAQQKTSEGFDLSYGITGSLGVLRADLQQSDFRLMMCLSDLNLAYDDTLEGLFSAPRAKIDDPTHGGVFVGFEVDIESISLLLFHDQEPLAELFYGGCLLNISKFNDSAMDLSFTSRKLLGVFSKEAEENEVLKEMFSIPEESMLRGLRLSHVLLGPLTQSCESESKPIFKADLACATNGSKDMIVQFLQLRVNFHQAVFQKIQNFFYFGLPTYTDETPFDYLQGSWDESMLASSLTVNVSVQQPLVLFPALVSSRVIVGQSDLSFKYFREREVLSLGGQVPAALKQLIFHQLQLYTCRPEELSSQARFRAVQKRKILEPIQIICKFTETRVSQHQSLFQVQYQAGRLNFVVSHRDLMLLRHAFEYQSRVLEQSAAVISKLAGGGADSSDEEDLKAEEPQSTALRTTYNYYVAGISLVLLNDAAGAYSPILDLNVGDLSAMAVRSSSNWNLKSGVTLKSNYYNPLVNQWEPLLELFSCDIEVFEIPLNNPKSQVNLRSESSLNFNLSEPMMRHMLKIQESWLASGEEEVKEVVSPLSILNTTGYQVLVEKTIKQPMATVPDTLLVNSGETVEYQIDTNVTRVPELYQEVVTLYLFEGTQPSEAIANIPINKVQSVQHNVQVGGQSVPVIVQIEMLNTRKILKISGPLGVRNKADVAVKLTMTRGTFSEAVLCAPGSVTDIPLQYLRGLVGFAPEGADPALFFNVMTDLVRKPYLQTRVGSFYLVVSCKNKGPHKLLLTLRSPVTYCNHLPVPIRLLLFYDNGYRTQEVQIASGGTYQDHSCSINSELTGSLYMSDFSGSNRISILSPPKRIKLLDIKKNVLNIEIFSKKKGAHRLVFYSSLVIINNAEMPLSFFYKKASQKLKPVPGQNYRNHIIPCNSAKRLALGLGKHKADTFKINTVGVRNIIHFSTERTPQGCRVLYQFIYGIQITQVIPQKLIFTRVVTISPRFVILNRLPSAIFLRVHQSPADPLKVPVGQRLPFHWPDFTSSEPLLALRQQGQDLWDWTGAFSISNLGTFPIQCRGPEGSFRLIKVDIRVMGDSVFVVFGLEDQRYSSYRIDNHSNIMTLEASQAGFQDLRRLSCASSVAFAWTQPHSPHILMVRFFLNAYDTSAAQSFKLDKINRNYKVKIDSPEIRHTLHVYVFNEGSTKVIEFSDDPIRKKALKFETIYKHFVISAPLLGISIIEYSRGTACEILYLSMGPIKIEAQKIKRLWLAECSVETLQIDNQTAPCPIYPVLLSPEQGLTKPVIQISVSSYIHSDPKCFNFEACELLVQTLCLRLESSIVRRLLSFVGRLFFEEKPVYESVEVFNKFGRATWRLDELLASDKRFYFGRLKLCPIKIVCSFIPLKDNEDTATMDTFATVAGALGMAIIAVDAAPIKLYTVEMHNLDGTQAQILSALWMHYKAQLTTELFTLIGHAVVLGNPIGLFNNLGTGVFDFFYEPAQGMIKGPVSAGKGFLKGTRSLVANTVQGTFGTFSKLTSSLATGLTMLAQDKDYSMARQRDQAINKPKNVVDGLGLGFKSLFTNIGKGFAGIITEPIKGYKKNKMKGLMAGGARGFSGLIVKPVAGVLDAASLTAEGIKNTAKKAQVEVPRRRMPRPFYGPFEVVKPYNEHDAQVVFFMGKLNKGAFRKEKFVGQCVSKELRGQVWVVAIYLRVVILCDVRSSNVIWVVETKNVQTFEVVEQGVRIHTTPSKNKETKGKTAFLIPFQDKAAVAHIIKKLNYVVNNQKLA